MGRSKLVTRMSWQLDVQRVNNLVVFLPVQSAVEVDSGSTGAKAYTTVQVIWRTLISFTVTESLIFKMFKECNG